MVLTEQNLRSKLTERQPRRCADGAGRQYAAVAAVLRYRAEPEILLIRRARAANDPWSGQMAFPGGRQDASDTDLVATAVRETREEVGVDLEQCAELIGRLDDLKAVARALPVDLVIAPHVFVLVQPVTPVPNAGEVDQVLFVPLEPMLSGRSATTRPYEIGGRRLELPAYRVGDEVVWGLTYRMLQMLFEMLRGT